MSISLLSPHKCLLLLVVSSRLHRDQMRVLKQATSMSVLALVTVARHAVLYPIVLLVMIRVTVVMLANLCKVLSFMTDHVMVVILVLVQIHANLCKDLPFMTDHVMVPFLVSRLKMPPSEKDRVTNTAKAASIPVVVATTCIVVDML